MTLRFYRGDLGDLINPKVFLDISIGGEPTGRIVARLRKDVVPKTVEVSKRLRKRVAGEARQPGWDQGWSGLRGQSQEKMKGRERECSRMRV